MKKSQVVPYSGYIFFSVGGHPDTQADSARLFRAFEEFVKDSRAWGRIVQLSLEYESICDKCGRKWEPMSEDPLAISGPTVCAWCEAPEKED